MAPTTTTKFKLLKPAVGGDNNQWGATLNGTLDQLDGLLGTVGTPVVDDVAARDALFPAPNVDALAIIKSLGYLQRFGVPSSGANKWLPTGITRDAGPVVTPGSKGASGLGVLDDSSFFTSADAATTGHVEVDPGTYRIGANIVLNKRLKFWTTGAVMKLDAGVSVTITNPDFDARNFQCFDTSAVGSKIIWGGRPFPTFNPMWWGVIGNGVHDDAPNWNQMLAQIPDRSIVEVPTALKSGIATQVVVTGKTGVRIRSNHNPAGSDQNTLAPSFYWLGPRNAQTSITTTGAGGGAVALAVSALPQALPVNTTLFFSGLRMAQLSAPAVQGAVALAVNPLPAPIGNGEAAIIPGSGGLVFINGCSSVSVEGMGVFGQGSISFCDRGIVLDGFGFGATPTHCDVIRCAFWNNNTNDLWFGVGVSEACGQNHEKHQVIQSGFVGGSGIPSVNTGTVAGGTLGTITLGGGVVATPGRRIRIANPVTGVMNDTTVTNNSAGVPVTVLTIATPMVNAVTNVQVILDGAFGGGIIQNSANAKSTRVTDCDFIGCHFAIKGLGGNLLITSPTYDLCEVELDIEGSAEAGYETGATSEGSLQHLIYKSDQSFRISDSKVDSTYVKPNGSFFEFGANASAIEIENTACGGVAPSGSTIFGGTLSSNLRLTCIDCTFNGITRAQIGAAGLGAGVVMQFINCKGITDELGTFALIGGYLFTQRILDSVFNADQTAIHGEAVSGGTTGKAIGVRGRAYIGNGFQTGGDPVGVQGEACTQGIGSGNPFTPMAFRALAPALTGGTIPSAEGYRVESPPVSGDTITTMIGVRILAQKTAASTNGKAISQEGSSDINTFAGQVQFGVTKVESATLYIDIAAAGNATPNAAGAEEYRYRIAGAATVNNPTGLIKGMTFTLVIFNNTGGAITPTLGATFLGAGFGAIGANKSRSRRYQYDDVLTKLEPIGAVSEDF